MRRGSANKYFGPWGNSVNEERRRWWGRLIPLCQLADHMACTPTRSHLFTPLSGSGKSIMVARHQIVIKEGIVVVFRARYWSFTQFCRADRCSGQLA